MQTITIDIETLPTDIPFEAGFWNDEEEYKSTSLDGNFGRVLCIGYARDFEDDTPLEYGCFGWDEDTGQFESEKNTLSDFWEWISNFIRHRDTIVGHNIMDFDLPFIIKRSIINGIEPTVRFNFARYRNQPIFDTMREWDCWHFQRKTSLKKLTYILELESPKDDFMNGGNLAQRYSEGYYREIFEYCMRDVKATRNVYRKMNFSYPAAGNGKVGADNIAVIQ